MTGIGLTWTRLSRLPRIGLPRVRLSRIGRSGIRLARSTGSGLTGCAGIKRPGLSSVRIARLNGTGTRLSGVRLTRLTRIGLPRIGLPAGRRVLQFPVPEGKQEKGMDGKEKAQHREERRRLSVQPGVKGVVTDQVEYLIGHDAESQQGPQHKLDPQTDCGAFQPLLKVSIMLSGPNRFKNTEEKGPNEHNSHDLAGLKDRGQRAVSLLAGQLADQGGLPHRHPAEGGLFTGMLADAAEGDPPEDIEDHPKQHVQHDQPHKSAEECGGFITFDR